MPWTDHWTPSDRMLRRIVVLQRDTYLLTGGRVLSRARAKPMMLLTTTGRRTGRPRTTPLPFFPHDDGVVVVASNSGRDQHPAWYLNALAEPEVRVQVGPRTSTATARPLEGEERDRAWARLVETAPWYTDYQSQTTRELPVVAITPDTPVGHDAPVVVDRPVLGWWVAVVSGMTALGLVAYHGRAWRWWSTHVTDAVPRGALRALFGAAVVTHLVEAATAVRMAESDGRHASALSWGTQTTILGYPSLAVLRRSVRERSTRSRTQPDK